MKAKPLRELHNALHDYGTVISGQFPSFYETKLANRTGRLIARDNGSTGYIKIVGRSQCHVQFNING